MIMAVVVMIRGAQITGPWLHELLILCTVAPNVYEFAIWNLFKTTLLAPRVLRSTLDFLRIRAHLVIMTMIFVVLIIWIGVALITDLTGCGGNIVYDW
jgi:hypothetical protein